MFDDVIDQVAELVDHGQLVVGVPRLRDLLGGSKQDGELRRRVVLGRRDITITPARHAEPRAVGYERALELALVRDSKRPRSRSALRTRAHAVHVDHLRAVNSGMINRRVDLLLFVLVHFLDGRILIGRAGRLVRDRRRGVTGRGSLRRRCLRRPRGGGVRRRL